MPEMERLSSLPAVAEEAGGGRWERRLTLATFLTVAAVPSILVIRDRWLDHAGVREFLRAAVWCRAPALCQTQWPSYFLLVFVAVAFVLTAFLVQRESVAMSRPDGALYRSLPPPEPRQVRLARLLAFLALLLMAWSALWVWLLRSGVAQVLQGTDEGASEALRGMGEGASTFLPWLGAGPSLLLALGIGLLAASAVCRLVPLALARTTWRRHGRQWLAQGFGLVAVVTALWAICAPAALGPWPALLLAAGAVAAVWPRLRRSGPVYWLLLLTLGLTSLHLGAWWRTIVGDEFSFYYEASDIAFQRPLAASLAALYDGTWVYGTHPFFSTLLQAIPLRLLGDTVFGWRFQDVLLVALALPLFYAFWSAFLDRRLALLATLFLATSHYLMAFAKIGYNNLQAYLAMAVVLVAATAAVRVRRVAAHVLLGLALGGCFYLFPAALYLLPVAGLLLLVYDPPVRRDAWRRWLAVAAGALLVAWPLLLQPDYWQAKAAGTLLSSPELAAGGAPAVRHVALNLGYALFSYLYELDESHFVAVSHVDPVTALFLLLGLGAALTAALKRDRFARFSLGSGLVLLLLAGASHDKIAPPNTRMFLLLPWYAWLAGVGLAWVLDALAAAWPAPRRPNLRRRVLAGLPVAVLTLLVVVNYVQAHPLSRRRLASRHQPVESLIVRLARVAEDVRQPGEPPPTWLLLRPADQLDTYGGQRLLELYQIPYARILAFDPRDPAAEAEVRTLLGDGEVLALVSPVRAEDFERDFGQALLDGNRASCPLKNDAGDALAVLWYNAAKGSWCEEGAGDG